MNLLLKNKIEQRISDFIFDSGLSPEDWPETERAELMHHSKITHVPRKSVIYSEGEPPKGIYYIRRGKVKISQLNFDGSVQILFIYNPMNYFGHRTLLANDKQPVTATALEDCELLFVEKDHFLRVVQGSEKLSQILMKSLCHEFTVLVNRINVFAQKGIKERLALFLLILNETYKQPGQEEYEAEIRLNRNDLACFTGTSVENLVRMLKQFKDNNYVRTNGKSIFINDFEALYSLTGLS